MVSPPSSTLDRYNKKEATCTKVNQSQNYYFGNTTFIRYRKIWCFFNEKKEERTIFENMATTSIDSQILIGSM